MRAALLAAALIGPCAALCLPGCGAAGPVSLAPPPAPLTARDYSRQYDRFTREGSIVSPSSFDTVLLVYATLRSPSFQSAYAARYIDLYQIKDPAQQQAVRQKADAYQDTVSFLLQLTSHGYNTTDLDPSRALWRVVLVDDTGTETLHTSLSLVRAPKDVSMERYSSDLRGVMAGPMTRLWNITFPNQRSDGTPLLRPGLKRLTLRIAGPQGKLDLNWDLK